MATDEASAQANRSAMDPRRLVVIFYLVATIISGLFFEHMLGQIWAQFGLPDPVILTYYFSLRDDLITQQIIVLNKAVA